MQITDISLQLQEQTANNTQQPAAKAAVSVQQPAATAAAKPKDDTVELSMAAQVQLLYQQGNSASEIAMKLHIDVKTVDSYLQTTNSTQTKSPQPYGPAAQTTPASKPEGDGTKPNAPAWTEPRNEQAGTVAQNSSEPGSYAKTINRFTGSGNTVTTAGTK